MQCLITAKTVPNQYEWDSQAKQPIACETSLLLGIKECLIRYEAFYKGCWRPLSHRGFLEFRKALKIPSPGRGGVFEDRHVIYMDAAWLSRNLPRGATAALNMDRAKFVLEWRSRLTLAPQARLEAIISDLYGVSLLEILLAAPREFQNKPPARAAIEYLSSEREL